MMFRPSERTLEGFEGRIKDGPAFTEGDFVAEYQYHLVSLDNIAYSAKVFLAKRWKEVKDWTGLEVIICDNSQKKTDYYRYFPHSQEIQNANADIRRKNPGMKAVHDMFDEMEKERAARHNPVRTVTRMVLDTSDGDFSVTINDKDHLWIDDESVVIIADYADKQIKAQQS